MVDEKFIVIGILIATLGELQYLWDTIRGNARPNRVTWLLWGVFPLIAFAAQASEGTGAISYLSLAAGLISFLIVAASFLNKKAYWKTATLDYICAGIAILGAVVWVMTKDASVAIIFSVIADICAGIPTYIKAYRHPETESPRAYLISSVGYGIGLLTIHRWTFDAYGFAGYLFVGNLILFLLARRSPSKLLRRK